MFAFGCWAGIKMLLHEKCMSKWYENIFFTTLWFCLLDRYQNVCVWFMARNCRFPKVGTQLLPTWEPQVTIARNCRFPEVGTPGSQPGNHGLPLQATAGYQRLELMLPNLGTLGYHCKELPVPKGWNWWFPTWEPKHSTVHSTLHSTLHSTFHSTLHSTLHSTFARLRHRNLDSSVHSTLHSTFARLRQHPAQHPA